MALKKCDVHMRNEQKIGLCIIRQTDDTMKLSWDRYDITSAAAVHRTPHCREDIRSDDRQCHGSSLTSRKAWSHIDRSGHNRPTQNTVGSAVISHYKCHGLALIIGRRAARGRP